MADAYLYQKSRPSVADCEAPAPLNGFKNNTQQSYQFILCNVEMRGFAWVYFWCEKYPKIWTETLAQVWTRSSWAVVFEADGARDFPLGLVANSKQQQPFWKCPKTWPRFRIFGHTTEKFSSENLNKAWKVSFLKIINVCRMEWKLQS